MTSNPDQDPSKQVAHVLLDLVSAYDQNASPETNHRAIETAFPRLEAVGAVSANYDAQTDVLDLDISPLLTGIGFITELLIQAMAERAGVDKTTIIYLLRQQLDSFL